MVVQMVAFGSICSAPSVSNLYDYNLTSHVKSKNLVDY